MKLSKEARADIEKIKGEIETTEQEVEKERNEEEERLEKEKQEDENMGQEVPVEEEKDIGMSGMESRDRSRSPHRRASTRGRKDVVVKKPKKHIQGMEEAELIDVKNDGECGWAAIGLGNSIANIKGSNYDAVTKKAKHQLIREMKNSFGETTRLKMYGNAEGKGK